MSFLLIKNLGLSQFCNPMDKEGQIVVILSQPFLLADSAKGKDSGIQNVGLHRESNAILAWHCPHPFSKNVPPFPSYLRLPAFVVFFIFLPAVMNPQPLQLHTELRGIDFQRCVSLKRCHFTLGLTYLWNCWTCVSACHEQHCVFSPQLPGKWEEVKVSVVRPGPIPTSSPCGNTIPADDLMSVALPSTSRWVLANPELVSFLL